ncbi:MAG TPA: hypothetical protein VD906_08115 [Caulobacteraceae bacterium]|nr:hypothetical protein [Caulobacteraceae bacterium]
MRILILAAAIAATCGVALADEPADASKSAPAADGNEMICKYERRTGSNLPRKVCLTRAQREQLAAEARLQLRQSLGNNGTAPVEKPIIPSGS